MGLDQLFTDYEPLIQKLFDKIASENGLHDSRSAVLDFTDSHNTMLFCSKPSKRCVRVEWRGIASLWAMSQAVGRLAPAMFGARRAGSLRVDLSEGSPEALGYQFIGYAKDLSVPQKWRWNSYFPMPNPNASDTNARSGDVFFLRALEWILRHEVAHIALGHQDSPWDQAQSRAEERDADRHATLALTRDLGIDPNRTPGSQPSAVELELERRAFAVGVGLIWVAMYEDTRSRPSNTHPPISDRLYRSLADCGLAEDSLAAEVLSDFIKAWVDPEADGLQAMRGATARAAMDDACSRLDSYIRSRQPL